MENNQKFKVHGISVKGISPEKLHEIIHEMYSEHNGKLTGRIVLNYAKNKNHPLHKHFEWNNERAGDKFRLEQARKLIGAIFIHHLNIDGKEVNRTRAFINIMKNEQGSYTENFFDPNKESYYSSLEDTMASPAQYEYSLERAKKEFLFMRNKYRNFVELKEVFEAIDKIA